MIYSRNQINKFGNIVLGSKDESEVSETQQKIDEWRNSHLSVMDKLYASISKEFEENGIKYVLSSQRLKRMSSIILKLDLHPDMGLGGLCDIGGIRFVFEDVITLQRAIDLCSSICPEGFSKMAPRDYINHPKDSGYRSYHLVFKRESDNKVEEGLKIELQLRTKLQHNWATAVETAGLISNTSIKSGQGSDEWQDFFRVVSALFSMKESLPRNEVFANYTRSQLLREFNRIDSQKQYVDLLSALKTTIVKGQDERYKNGYQVLFVEFEPKTVKIYSFQKNDGEKATALYSQLESQIEEGKEAVVMVNVKNKEELKQAYQSYFLNANEFIAEMMEYKSFRNRL